MTIEGKKKLRAIRAFSAISSPFHIEVDKVGRFISVMVSGVLGVEEFSDSEVLLCVSGMKIKMAGRGLCLTVYENKTIEIVGKIDLTEYVYDKSR